MNQLYFKINLNKYGELRRKIELEKRTFRNAAIGFAFFTILLYVFALLMNGSLQSKVKSRRQLLSQIRKEIETYQISGEFLSTNDLQRLSRISTERIFWAKKLVALAEQTTDKIAITHFSFKDNTLSLMGITKLDKQEKEFDLIDEFITKLKANEQISADFPEIKIVQSRKDMEKEVEILRFRIDCIAPDFEEKGDNI
ncbi:MAG: hypothetical protein JW996_00050, partial [Candidatus Cloacimonetes bacterium]|nr:hypothetical protein [Candidatus Cloacimonadota bacterium]